MINSQIYYSETHSQSTNYPISKVKYSTELLMSKSRTDLIYPIYYQTTLIYDQSSTNSDKLLLIMKQYTTITIKLVLCYNLKMRTEVTTTLPQLEQREFTKQAYLLDRLISYLSVSAINHLCIKLKHLFWNGMEQFI